MKIFLIGIGGIGMQGLARLYLGRGDEVIGSDLSDFPEREELKNLGAQVFLGHDPRHLDANFDLVVYSSAIPQDNAELKEAQRLNLKIRKRSQALGELMEGKIGIAVSGTHGKTTTSTMIAEILEKANLSPTVVVGAEVRSIRGSARWGQGPYLVAEACEFDRSFLDLPAKIAVITNIEPDHLDYYTNGFEEIKQAFARFIDQLPPRGLVIACGDDPAVREVVDQKRKTIFYGEGKDNDLILEMGPLWQGKNNFILRSRDNHFKLQTFLTTPGAHIAQDAAAAAALSWQLKISPQIIKETLEHLSGVKRRFEIISDSPELTIIDDYGHHPTEIIKTLSAARHLFWGRRLIVVFQSHQLSRTRLLLADFAKSFKDADLVIVAPIWAVRDKKEENGLIQTEDLVKAINQESHNARFLGGFEEIIGFLKKGMKKGDVIITLGAAKTDQLAKALVTQLT